MTAEIPTDANACTGEPIHLTGELTLQAILGSDTQEHLDQGVLLHSQAQVRAKATGVGTVSGTQYPVHEVLQNTYDSPNIPAPQSTLTFKGALHAITKGPAGNLLIRVAVHITVLPSGEFKVTTDKFSAVCHG